MKRTSDAAGTVVAVGAMGGLVGLGVGAKLTENQLMPVIRQQAQTIAAQQTSIEGLEISLWAMRLDRDSLLKRVKDLEAAAVAKEGSESGNPQADSDRPNPPGSGNLLRARTARRPRKLRRRSILRKNPGAAR